MRIDSEEAGVPDVIALTGERDEVAISLEHPCRLTGKANDAIKNVRLVKEADGTQYAEATDAVMAVRNHMWGQWDADEVDVLVPPAVRQAVRAMANGVVTVTFDGSHVEVSGTTKSKYRITLPADASGWPNLKWDQADWNGSKLVDVKELLDHFQTAARFAMKSEQKPQLRGVNIRAIEEDGERKLVIASTDSFRMYRRVVEASEAFQEDATIPLNMVNELTSLFPDGKVKISSSPNLFYVATGDESTMFFSRKISQPYPDVDRLIPKEYTATAKFSRQEISDCIDRVTIIGKKGTRLAMQFEKDEIQIDVKSDLGEGWEYCSVDYDGEPMRIGFNPEHFTSMLGVFKASDAVTLKLVSPQRPAMVESAMEPTLFMIMPVKI